MKPESRIKCQKGCCIAGNIAGKMVSEAEWPFEVLRFEGVILLFNKLTRTREIPHPGFITPASFCIECGHKVSHPTLNAPPQNEYYAPVSVPDGLTLLPCPFCGAAASLDEYHDGFGSITKVVSCQNGGDETHEECVMHLPSEVAYRATKREAIDVWNTRAQKTMNKNSFLCPAGCGGLAVENERLCDCETCGWCQPINPLKSIPEVDMKNVPMVAVDTSKLSLAALDWAVATAIGWKLNRPQDAQFIDPKGAPRLVGNYQAHDVYSNAFSFNPSTRWEHGGPLLDQYSVGFLVHDEDSWIAHFRSLKSTCTAIGPTHLVAACRVIVLQHFGESMQIPEFLVKTIDSSVSNE